MSDHRRANQTKAGISDAKGRNVGLKEASYIEIDDADTERTHLWVRVNDADGNTDRVDRAVSA